MYSSIPASSRDCSNRACLDFYSGTESTICNPGWYAQYTFFGNYIAVYGIIIPWIEGDRPVAHYSVDGAFEQVRTSPNVSTVEGNALFYQINNLPLDVHTLMINVTTASSDNPWIFDYLRIANATNSNSQSTPPTSTIDVASSTSTAVATVVPSGSSSPSSKSSSFPTAPVVGAAAGGIVLIVALLALLYYLWKRARTRAQEVDLEDIKGKQNGPSPPVNARVAPAHSDGAMVAASMLPSLPPGKEPQPIHSPPTLQPLGTGPAPYPSWPCAPAQQQQWAPHSAGYGHQLPEVAMAPTMYAHPPYVAQGEQWSSYPANSSQSVHSARILPADQTSYFAPATLPRANAEAASIHSLVLNPEPDTGDVQRSLIHRHPGHARAPSALSLATSVGPSAANSRMDLAVLTPSGTPDSGARMLGGMVTYDGKDSRLTTVAPADAVSPVDGEVGSGSHDLEGRHSMPPPAYVP